MKKCLEMKFSIFPVNKIMVRPIYSGFTVFITALPPNLKISYKEKKERKKETARRSDTYKLLIMIKVEVSSSSSNY